VKLKLKLDKRQIIIPAVAALAVLGLMLSRSAADDEQPQPGSLDAAGAQACSDFAAGYPDAKSKADRLALADRVTASSGKSGVKPISRRAMEMGDSANDTNAAWKASATALKQACEDAGWHSP
jgi:hypothetical protein